MKQTVPVKFESKVVGKTIAIDEGDNGITILFEITDKAIFERLTNLDHVSISQEMPTVPYETVREDLALIVAQVTSGGTGAEPEEDDFDLADALIPFIEARIKKRVDL